MSIITDTKQYGYEEKVFLDECLLVWGYCVSIGLQYLEHKELNETVKKTVSSYSSPAGQETVLGTINSVEVSDKDTVAAPRHYNSFAEAVNAYSELDANGNDVHMVICYGLDNDQDPIAFMEELKRHGSDPEWVDNYCKKNNISVGYEITTIGRK